MNASSDRIQKILVSIARANTPPVNGPSVLYPVSSLDDSSDTANLAGHRRHKHAWIAFAEHLGTVGSLSASLIALNLSLLTAIIMFGSPCRWRSLASARQVREQKWDGTLDTDWPS